MDTWNLLLLCNILIQIYQSNGQVKSNLDYQSQNVTVLRERAFDGIIKKLKKISAESVTNVSSAEKGNILRSIENKLKKAAQPLGKIGDKYVNLIMKNLRFQNTTTNFRSKSFENISEKAIKLSDEGNTQNLIESRDVMINMIMQKINKLTDKSGTNLTNVEDKEKVLNDISNKIKKASQSLGAKAKKYHNIIMGSIRKKFNKVKPNEVQTKSNDERRYALNRKEETEESRNAMLNYILEKINKISETTSTKNQRNQLALIERKLRENAQPLGNRGMKYINLIMRALRSQYNNVRSQNAESLSQEITDVVEDAMKLNNLVKTNEGNQEIRKDAVEDIARSIEKIIKKKYHSDRFNDDVIEKIKNKTFEYMKTSGIIKDDHAIKLLSDLIVDAINTAVSRSSKMMRSQSNRNGVIYDNKKSIKSESCKKTIERTCVSIRNMNILKCAYVEEYVSFSNLCDGKHDCTDRSDEKRCAQQAIDKVRYAHSVLTALEMSLENECLMADINESVLSKQNQILRDVLKAQLNFIEKYKDENISIKNMGTRDEIMTPPVKEISDVISTLTIALEKALCTHRDMQVNSLRRFNEVLDQDIEESTKTTEVIWPPKTCACTQEQCYNCTIGCKRICWHRSSLTQWNCDSVNNTAMVSLNELCDGKYDCYDESDEKKCFTDNVHGKFEAHKIFSEITESLKLKASKEYKKVSNQIWDLLNSISSLERLSLKSNPNPNQIKEIRDTSFTSLGNIYSGFLKHTTYPYEAADAYIYLLSINQQLGAILKLIGTGNKKIISDNCLCRKGKCAATFCTRRCQKACVIEPKLTKYYCGNILSNISVELENICDGKSDCPRKEDENSCSEDICRSHHITMLRHKIEKTGKKQKGTAMGEILETWKTKILGTLKVAEKAGKPSKQTLRELVKNILGDLVLTYGVVENYRRKDNNYALDDFMDIADTIIDTLKSCKK